jgi:hypothetical protein
MAETKLEEEMNRIATFFQDVQSKCRIDGNWVVQKPNADKYNDLCIAIIPYQGSLKATKELADLFTITGEILKMVTVNLENVEFAQLREMIKNKLFNENE